LGKRIGISQSAVIQLEASEDNNTISLSSLRKLADGLECDLVYALVPRKSLNDIMKEQARRRAESMVKSVANSMELEGQNVSDQERQHQIETISRGLLTRPRTGLWRDS
jgi:predicted DNA-binding mobile mystery protein A